MGVRIIQGFFPGIGGLPDLAAFAPQPIGPNLSMRQPVTPPSALSVRALQARTAAGVAPPTPVVRHAARQPLQAKGGTASIAIDLVRIGLVRGGGSPLPGPLLAKMEAAFGADFSAVRVHVGPQAGRIGALAFTVGSDLYFGPGQFQPDTPLGQQLIGHELAHVVQQRQGRVRAQGAGVAVVHDPALEAEADRLGMRAAAWSAPVQRAAAPGARAAPTPPGKIAQAMKRGRYSDNAYSDINDYDSQASDSESEAEDDTRTIKVPTAKKPKFHHEVVFNHTKRQGFRIIKGVRVTKRDPKTKRRLVAKVDNHVYKGRMPALSADAGQIHDVIPRQVNGKANHSFGATTVVCAILLDQLGKYRKYCFTNLDRTVSSDMAAMAISLGYHVVVAPKAHAEMEMTQYLHTYKRKLVAIGCDKEHCQECNHLMARYYDGGVNTDQGTSDNIFDKYNWNLILTMATGLPARPSQHHGWAKKGGHRTDRAHYAITPEQTLALGVQALVPIAPNGDCLYAALVAAGHAVSVAALRTRLATAVRNNTIDVSGWGDRNAIANQIGTMGSYDNVVGDYAPELLTRLLNIRLSVIREDGVAVPVGVAGPVVTLVRVTYPLAHYHLAQ